MSWDSVKEAGGGFSILPAGLRQYEVTSCGPIINEHTGRREFVIHVAAPGVSGEFDILLEPWSNTAENVETWESLTKAKLKGLGFTPSDGSAPFNVAVDEFARTGQASLLGAIIELDVKHIQRNKDGVPVFFSNGDPAMNQRVMPKRIVTPPVSAPAVPAGVAGGDADLDGIY